MNTDENPEDARLVIERFKLKYPTLRAKHLSKKFGVIAFPSLFVIDQKGIVRHVHVGYSKTLRADVGKEIDQLLTGAY
jgi:peroxiredoxin